MWRWRANDGFQILQICGLPSTGLNQSQSLFNALVFIAGVCCAQ